MKSNALERLASSYEFNNIEDFFNYIIESYTNGQRTQFNDLMSGFIKKSSYRKQDFQICIINACNTFGLKNAITIIKKYKGFEFGEITDDTIINAFYDNSRNQLDEVKSILINNIS